MHEHYRSFVPGAVGALGVATVVAGLVPTVVALGVVTVAPAVVALALAICSMHWWVFARTQDRRFN